MRASIRSGGLAIAASLGLASAAQSTMLLQMNLKDLSTRADKIFRGTVIAVDTGTVRAGGADLPTVTYRLRVGEAFKGQFDVKGEPYVELRMVGTFKDAGSSAAVRHLSVLRDVPRLEMGREYVLFTTRPSSIGLSTTVGLGQGAFTIVGQGNDKEAAVNAFDNVGLNRGIPE